MEVNDPGSRTRRELKAVTLDLWQTLISEADGTSQSATRREMRVKYVDEVLVRRGFFYEKGRVEEAVTTIAAILNADHALGVDMSFSERIAQFLGLLDEHLAEGLGEEGLAEVGEAIDRTFIEAPPVVLDRVHETLDALKSLDLKLALISNTGFTSPETYHRWFTEVGLLHYFDHMAFSNGVSAAKPSAQIFTPVLEALGVDAEYAMHVGDNLHTDVAGAASMGMRTAWISGIDSSEPVVAPDYTVSHVAEVAEIAGRWRAAEPAL
jgi:putative hydrolase of the HAD superfamily